MKLKQVLGMIGVILSMTSCEKAIIGEGEESLLEEGEVQGQAQLCVVTRAGGDAEGSSIADGRIYVVNSKGICVEMLTTNEENKQTTTVLPAGSYTLYAIGGDDLLRYTLPSKGTATASSVIKCQDGKVLDDLLQAVVHVDLEDGEVLNQQIVLEHKVLCLDEIDIKQVPTSATKVEVAFAPLYSAIQLDGTYCESPTETYKVALTKQADGKTWRATPQQMLFPSKGKPTIKVTITTDNGTQGFSYNSTEDLPANHHFSISGTFKVAQGVSITGILTSADWGEDRTISFDLDNSNQTDYHPVAGQFTNGYYAVTVDEANRRAVLFGMNVVPYEAPAGGSDNATWKAALQSKLTTWEKPVGINGNWRLPTLEEASIIIRDPQVVTVHDTGNTMTMWCLDGDELKWAYGQTVNNNLTIQTGNSNFRSSIFLRPVIDITY